ncbi:TonB-dependent receptor [Deminuibacter soli]|uniref:TonB-dependent receptor n=1 Tax=Deminuibacter soli TaxID=2291815 RepID=A0A3E1NIA4_9BACT|nr:TonB-dependent receptor [Deminuibacter soli]RFM27518.1 TonB-dependent receptor [Deminuibacter soli]
MRLLFTFCCLFIAAGAYAQQTIRGTVLDAQSREPLEQALVQYGNASVTTNKQGVFEISGSAISHITVSFIGYQPQQVMLGPQQRTVLVQLQRGAPNLGDVVVNSAAPQQVLHIISRLDLNTEPVKSAQEVLRKVPGLFIAQHQGGGKAEQLFLRGFDLDHGTDINISADGIPVNMVSHAHGQGYADLHFIIPELVKDIDYGKGPYYVGYGNLATAGYVNLSTINSAPQNTLKAEGGRFDTYRVFGMMNLVSAKQQEQGTYALAAGEYQYSNGPFVLPQHFNRINLFAKYGTQLNTRNQLSIMASTLSSSWNATGQVPERAVTEKLIDRFGYIDSIEGGNTHRTNVSVSLNTQLSDHVYWDNQVYYTRYDFKLFSNFTFYATDTINGDRIRQQEGRNLFGYNSRLHKQVSTTAGAYDAVYGAGMRLDKTNGSSLSHMYNRDSLLAYAQYGDITESNEWLYTDQSFKTGNWLFNAGLRADALQFAYLDRISNSRLPSQSKATLSPKVNVQYTFSNSWQLYIKAGKGFHSNDTRAVVMHQGTGILPAAYGSDLGVVWKPAPHLIINAALWYLYLQQEFVYAGDDGTIEPAGRTRRTGIDFSARYQLCKWLFADANLNAARPRSIDAPKDGNRIPLAPTLTSTGGISWHFSNGISGGLRYRYMHNRPANENNSIVAHGYTVTDFSCSYTRRCYEIGIAIENLLNVQWNEAQFDTVSRLKGEAAPLEDLNFTPGNPFNARLKLAVFF